MILHAGSVSSKPVGTPPQVGFDTIIPSYHWCLGKRCLFLSPQEKVQATAVFCLPRDCITSEDFCWSLALYQEFPHWVVIPRVTWSIFQQLSKSKMGVGLENIRFFKGKMCFENKVERSTDCLWDLQSSLFCSIFTDESCLGHDVMTAITQVCMLRNKHGILLWP